MAGIQLSGLVSGLDTQSIIDQLMTAEKIPRTKITLDQDATTMRSSLLTDIGTKLTAVKTANDDLKSVLTWLDTQTVASDNDAKVSAVRTGGAAPGGYDVSVSQLATAARQTYAFQSPAADGPMTILNADGTVRTSIALKAGASVDDAVSAINGKSDANVYAVNVNGALVLAAKTTGDTSGFTATGVGTNTETIAGKNAKFNVNGTDYERQTNTVADALPGVTLTLKGKTSGTDTVGLTVSAPGPDIAGVVAKVQTFVTAYNDLVTASRADLADQPVSGATTTADAQKGTLFGDSGISDMLSSMRTVLSTPVTGMSGAFTSLADLGISTGTANAGASINQDSVDGKLVVDTAKLTAALTSNPLAAKQILGGVTTAPGVMQSFGTAISGYQGTGGLIAQRVSSAASDLSDLQNRLDQFDMRMDMKQQWYQNQFDALETAMAASQSQGSTLTGLTAAPSSSSSSS